MDSFIYFMSWLLTALDGLLSLTPTDDNVPLLFGFSVIMWGLTYWATIYDDVLDSAADIVYRDRE